MTKMNLEDALFIGSECNSNTTIIDKTKSLHVQTVQLPVEILLCRTSLLVQRVPTECNASVARRGRVHVGR